MKKNFLTKCTSGMVAMLCATALVTASCDKDENNDPDRIAVTGVTLDKPTLSIGINESATLTATVTPEDATDRTVEWKSADEAIATVSVAGKVTAVAVGETKIIVTTNDGGLTAECVVTVNPGPSVTGVTLDRTALTVGLGKTAALVATVIPEDAYDKTVTWESSAPAVATVADGVVTGVTEGTATITVTTVSGGFTATCEVTVKDAPDPGTIMFEDGFEDGLDAWQNLDEDGDGFAWKIGLSEGGDAIMEVHEGVACAYSESYDNAGFSALTPDNWLISPGIDLLGGKYILSWWVTGQDPSYCSEKYAVLVGTSPDDLSTFTSIFEGTVETGRDYRNKTADLSDYAGQTVYLAFRHYDITDMFCIDLDYVQVFAGTEVPAAAPSRIPGPVNVNSAAKAVK